MAVDMATVVIAVELAVATWSRGEKRSGEMEWRGEPMCQLDHILMCNVHTVIAYMEGLGEGGNGEEKEKNGEKKEGNGEEKEENGEEKEENGEEEKNSEEKKGNGEEEGNGEEKEEMVKRRREMVKRRREIRSEQTQNWNSVNYDRNARAGQTKVLEPRPKEMMNDILVQKRKGIEVPRRGVVSKASCLGLALRNARWFESSWGKKLSHEISANVWDRCPPSIVMHLESYDR
ncbi:hypothetical protein ANN_23477 [Periplaneta americana]|uniref:Uncharacterized protein n=1 Tax=Periplaneta americana TaxID=6978 RepID=A0ABQ8SL78_PERAM|nr:hypothetical protein ANN_23477 [Periplaneta americana]